MQMNVLLALIAEADVESIDYILSAAMDRKQALYPDWEIFYCAAPKDSISSPEEMVRRAWEFDQELKAKYG